MKINEKILKRRKRFTISIQELNLKCFKEMAVIELNSMNFSKIETNEKKIHISTFLPLPKNWRLYFENFENLFSLVQLGFPNGIGECIFFESS